MKKKENITKLSDDESDIPAVDSDEEGKAKAESFKLLWLWIEKHVNRVERLKGWTLRERGDAEFIALMHSELSEGLEALRLGNIPSDHIEALGIEEEFADIIIRMMGMAYVRGYDIPSALFKKLAFNTTRPYQHGGKLF